uniref:Uncharacterized protein n=1 Tax=Glossina pallidipes TaxID=7398 RepID=A0A1A9ZHT8_GLOPL
MGNRTSPFESLENTLSKDEDKPRACREYWIQLLNNSTQFIKLFSPLTASRCNFSRFDDCGHFVNFMWIAIATNDDVARDGDGDGDGDRHLELFAFCINFNMLHTIKMQKEKEKREFSRAVVKRNLG